MNAHLPAVRLRADTRIPVDAKVRSRDIPYNYTSFSDREIVVRLLNESAWDALIRLRVDPELKQRLRILHALLGDIWVVRRNPYLQDDLLDNPKRRALLIEALNHRLGEIEKRRRADLTEHGDEAGVDRAARRRRKGDRARFRRRRSPERRRRGPGPGRGHRRSCQP